MTERCQNYKIVEKVISIVMIVINNRNQNLELIITIKI